MLSSIKCFFAACHQVDRGYLSDKCWEGPIDPVQDGVVMPEVGAPDVSLGGEQRGEHRGLSSPVNSERPLVAGHVCVHVARMDMVNHDVLPGVSIHHPLLDP